MIVVILSRDKIGLSFEVKYESATGHDWWRETRWVQKYFAFFLIIYIPTSKFRKNIPPTFLFILFGKGQKRGKVGLLKSTRIKELIFSTYLFWVELSIIERKLMLVVLWDSEL